MSFFQTFPAYIAQLGARLFNQRILGNGMLTLIAGLAALALGAGAPAAFCVAAVAAQALWWHSRDAASFVSWLVGAVYLIALALGASPVFALALTSLGTVLSMAVFVTD